LNSQSEVTSITIISRTAYPQFKHYPSNKELHELYTPTVEEIKFVTSRTRSKTGLLGLMVMLKSFQRLGYFTARFVWEASHTKAALLIQN
jgi:hypothetical protein